MDKSQQKKQLQKEAETYFWNGVSCSNHQNWEQAIQNYLKAATLDPDYKFKISPFLVMDHLLGLVLVKSQRRDEAIPYLMRSLSQYQKYKKRYAPDCDDPGFWAMAQVYALMGEQKQTLKYLRKTFEIRDRYVCQVYNTLEFAEYLEDPKFQDWMQQAIATVKQNRTHFDAAELLIMGCDHCRHRGSSTDSHDWEMYCTQCGNTFSYGGCSCDGCCGGTYAGFGGGVTIYQV